MWFCYLRTALQGHSAYRFIASVNPRVPSILTILFMLYANTCKLISVFTLGSVFIRKCVAPIHAFSVPNGCSTVQRRNIASSGRSSRRRCIRSSTSSCSQRLMRRFLLVVHFGFNAHDGHAEVQYLSITSPFSTVRKRQGALCPAGHRNSSLCAR